MAHHEDEFGFVLAGAFIVFLVLQALKIFDSIYDGGEKPAVLSRRHENILSNVHEIGTETLGGCRVSYLQLRSTVETLKSEHDLCTVKLGD